MVVGNKNEFKEETEKQMKWSREWKLHIKESARKGVVFSVLTWLLRRRFEGEEGSVSFLAPLNF